MRFCSGPHLVQHNQRPLLSPAEIQWDQNHRISSLWPRAGKPLTSKGHTHTEKRVGQQKPKICILKNSCVPAGQISTNQRKENYSRCPFCTGATRPFWSFFNTMSTVVWISLFWSWIQCLYSMLTRVTSHFALSATLLRHPRKNP